LFDAKKKDDSLPIWAKDTNEGKGEKKVE